MNVSWWQLVPLELWLCGGLWFITVLLEPFGGEPLSLPTAVTWILASGVAIGAVTVQWWAGRILSPGPFLGISVVTTPALFGLAMEVLGRFQGRWGWRRRHLDTWYGGMCFGLGLALGRLGGMYYLGTL